MSMRSLGAKIAAVTVLVAVAALSASNALPPGFTWVPVILATAGNSGEGSDTSDRDFPEEEDPEALEEEADWWGF